MSSQFIAGVSCAGDIVPEPSPVQRFRMKLGDLLNAAQLCEQAYTVLPESDAVTTLATATYELDRLHAALKRMGLK